MIELVAGIIAWRRGWGPRGLIPAVAAVVIGILAGATEMSNALFIPLVLVTGGASIWMAFNPPQTS